METATIYHIRVKGHLDLHWADWFDDLTLSHQENGETLLAGPVIDQAALYGLLLKIHNLNLVLLSINRVEAVQPSSAGPAASPVETN